MILMKKYKFLALTDHSGHSGENSLYALLRTLSAHERTKSVSVATRADARNAPFFRDMQTTEVVILPADENFVFETAADRFHAATDRARLEDFDVVLMRLPRPVSDEFLDFLTDKGNKQTFINDPQGIRKTSTKKFLLRFPEVCPDMRMVHNEEEVKAFADRFPIVLKPLKEYGGKGVVKIQNGRVNHGDTDYSLAEYLAVIKIELERDGYLAMKFLKNVTQGDKRIIVVNGQILAASLRLPAADSWLCNVAQGGTSVPAEPDAEERKIIKKIVPVLKEEGILIFGADTLTDDDGKRVLSEVNTLSIGGFPQAQEQTGRPVLRQAIDGIIEYADSMR